MLVVLIKILTTTTEQRLAAVAPTLKSCRPLCPSGRPENSPPPVSASEICKTSRRSGGKICCVKGSPNCGQVAAATVKVLSEPAGGCDGT